MKELISDHEQNTVNIWTATASLEERAKRKDKKRGLMIELLVMKYESELNEKIIAYSNKLNELSDADIENEYRMHFGDSRHG